MTNSTQAWLGAVALTLMGCPAGDDTGDSTTANTTTNTTATTTATGSDSAATSTTTGGDSTGGSSSDGMVDGGTCSASVTASVCGDVLASLIAGQGGAATCDGPGGDSGGEACNIDPVDIDETAAAALCDQICGSCSCPLGGALDACEYQGLQPSGEYAYRCSYMIGCGAGGCFE
jgi:hypothetical protein